MELKFFKPGASEFKRSEHPTSLLLKIINVYSSEGIVGKTKKEIKMINDENPSILFRRLVEEGVLYEDKVKDQLAWDDRFTSLFVRQGIIFEDDDNKIQLSNMSKKIASKNSNDFEFMPFSYYDFMLLLFVGTLNDNEGNNYLARAIDTINFGEMPLSNFYKKYIIVNYDEYINYLDENFDNEKVIASSINKLVKSGSGSSETNTNQNTSKIQSEISKLFISIHKSTKEECYKEKVKESLVELSKLKNANQKKWISQLLKSFENENEELKYTSSKKAEVKLNDIYKWFSTLTSDQIKNSFLKTVTSFGFYKKENEYKTLVDMYVTRLPIFSRSMSKISINNKLIQTVKNISRLIANGEITRGVFNGDLREVYMKMIHESEIVNISDIEFYPELNKEFLKKIVLDDELWVKRESKKLDEYKSVLSEITMDNLPTYYEFLTILYIYKNINAKPEMREFIKTINTKLDSSYLPIYHAGPGVPDAVITLEEEKIVLEPTLVINNSQVKHEYNIDKHAIDSSSTKAVLIAPKINERTLQRCHINNKASATTFSLAKIIPLSNAFLKKINTREDFTNLMVEIIEKIDKEDFDFN